MFELIKRLLSPKGADNSGKSLKKVVDELQHTHDLQDAIELLNDLNEKGRNGLWTTIVFWDVKPRTIVDIEMIGDKEVIIDGIVRLFAPDIDKYPVRRIETYSSIDDAIGSLFDSICFNRRLLCAKYGYTSNNQLILYVK